MDKDLIKLPVNNQHVSKAVDNRLKKDILITAGWISIGFGMYLIHTSGRYDGIIDAEFEVID